MKKDSSSPRTQAQIDASRANGAKSRGPVTPEGKARSSQNNLKHGLRSSRVVFANESLEKYHQLLNAYLAEWKPVGQSENDLLLQMVNTTWQLRRLEAQEAALFDTEMFLLKPDFDHCFTVTSPTMRQADALLTLAAQNPPLLDFFHKAHSRISRAYDRAFRNLIKLQTFRLGENPTLSPVQPDEQIGTSEPGNPLPDTESNCEEPEVFAWLSSFVPVANRPQPDRATWMDAIDADQMGRPPQS